jgi:hypothetical protein
MEAGLQTSAPAKAHNWRMSMKAAHTRPVRGCSVGVGFAGRVTRKVGMGITRQ